MTETMASVSLLRTKALMPSVLPSRITIRSIRSRMPARASAAAVTSSVPEPPSRMTSGSVQSCSGVTLSSRP